LPASAGSRRFLPDELRNKKERKLRVNRNLNVKRVFQRFTSIRGVWRRACFLYRAAAPGHRQAFTERNSCRQELKYFSRWPINYLNGMAMSAGND
jgi:hypothetical protein